MNRLLSFVLLICTGIATSCFAENRPNIVLIMADDLGGMDLSIYGNEFNETPNIDTLAEQGMVFNHAYAAPVCSATRASIQAGQYPARVGIFDFIPGHWRPYEEVVVPHHAVQHLPADIVTIGDTMQAAGYKTGYFGKWHLNEGGKHLPNARGYSEAYTYTAGLNGFYKPTFSPAYEGDTNRRVSLVLTDMGIDFIKENKDQPFFLFLSHYDVHVQLDADRDLIDKYLSKAKVPYYPGNAVYAAMIEHLDDSVGAIMQTIENLGLADNTIFIFYSDNGGVNNRFDHAVLLGGDSSNVYPDGHPLRYIATSNAPLRAGKGTLYEGGIRVPLVVRWPGKIPAGTTSDAIVSSVDFYPTFMQVARASPPESQVLDGVSMLPALTTGTHDPEREVFTHYPVYHHEQPMSALRKGDWKIVENLVTGEIALYNLKYDINELTDLKYSHEGKVRQMKKLLAGWQARTGAENPVPNPDFDAGRRFQWGKNPHKGTNPDT